MVFTTTSLSPVLAILFGILIFVFQNFSTISLRLISYSLD
jgi:hypothetical protein